MLLGSNRMGFLVLSMVLTTGCGTTVMFASTNPAPRDMQPRSVESVTVFSTSLPSQSYTEVGIIQARQSSSLSFDEFPEVLAEMRSEAAAIGCDAIVVNGRADSVQGSVTTHGPVVSGYTDTLEGLMATCIMFTAESFQQAGVL